MRVRVTQVVDQLTDVDDRISLPAGANGIGSTKEYHVPENTWKAAITGLCLDWFHGSVPIGNLEDFEIDVLADTSDFGSDQSG